MTHFFEKRDPWGNGRGLWVIVVMVFIAPIAWWSMGRVELKNDVENWLPSDHPQAKVLRWYHEHFKSEDRVLLTWEGSSLSDQRVRALAEKLEGRDRSDGLRRGGSKFVSGVVTPNEVIERMTAHKIGDKRVTREEAIKRLEGVLVGKGPLKLALTDLGRQKRKKSAIAQLKSEAKSKLGLEISVVEPAEESDEEFSEEEEDEDEDEGESDEDVAAASGNASENEQPFDVEVNWKAMHLHPEQLKKFRELAVALRGRVTKGAPQGRRLVDSCFFQPGSPVALSVSLSEAGISDRKATFAAIREAAVSVGIPENLIHMGGRPYAGHELNEAVGRAGWNTDYPLSQFHKRSPFLLSAMVGIALTFLMLRSIRLSVLVLVCAYYTMIVAVGIVPMTGGNMNMVLVVMPTLLMVLTISAAIHISNYWKHAAHENPATAIVNSVKMAWTPCALAAFTTAIGLLSLTTSPLSPVRDFGKYSAIGCVVSVLVVLYGLPSMLQYWPSKPPRKSEVDRTGWKNLGRLLAKHKGAVSLACFVLFLAGSAGLYRFRTETKVIRYFPDDARVVQDYDFLEENLSGIIPVETIIRFDESMQGLGKGQLNFVERMKLVSEIQQQMQHHRDISGTLSLADFLPVYDQEPKPNASLTSKLRYNRIVNEIKKRVRDEPSNGVRSFYVMTEEDADLAKLGDRRLNSKGDELWRITAQVAIMSDLDYGDLVGVGAYEKDAADNPNRKVGALNEIAQSVLKNHAGASHHVTGMVPLFLRTQQAVLDSLILSFGLAFGVIAIVMMILLRNPLAGLLTMVPNLLPVGLVFGLVSWGGLAVDIGTMITASVALGIAVDGTLHLLTWFRAGIRDGLDRSEAVAEALGHCGPAMWQTSAAVGLGLLMLYPADLLLVSRFGWLMAALIGAALVADVIFLPALLAGPLGRLIEKQVACSDPTLPPTSRSDPPAPHRQQATRSDPSRQLRVDE
jgi:predicted RND superfamily exporter protein